MTRQHIAGAALPFMKRHRSVCLTPKQPFPGAGEQDCRQTLIGDTGAILRWRLHCTPPGAMPASGQAIIDYKGQHLRGRIHLLIAGGRSLLHTSHPIRLHLSEQLQGHRVGPCKPASATRVG